MRISVNKRQYILLGTVITCAVLALISITWAAFSSTLNLSGQASVTAQSWDIDFTNTVNTKWTTSQTLKGTTTNFAELPTNSSGAFGLPLDQTASGFLGSLRMSGDKITYTWYVQNFGTFDATYSISGVIKTDTYASGSNVDIDCNTSDNSTDKTFCNNYVKTTVTIDGDEVTPSSSYSLGKAGSSTDHATVVLTIEILGTDKIYTGTLANMNEKNSKVQMLSNNINWLSNSNGDLDISVKSLTLTEKQNITETATTEEQTTKISYDSHINETWTYSYTGNEQEFTALYPGNYKIELWGASGSEYDSSHLGGSGAYTSGTISLDQNTKLYIYVGQNSGTQSYDESYNGGGAGNTGYDGGTTQYGYAGGGATDVRLVNGTWSNFDSLKSRIMVAAGGGGAGLYPTSNYGIPGAAGGLNGYDGDDGYGYGSTYSATGGTQISGGYNSLAASSGQNNGSFGIGGHNTYYNYGAGGGGGYYGGGASIRGHGGSGGGSSYISGHDGCNSISESSTSSSITHTGLSTHYSGYVFTNTTMIDGLGYSWTTSKSSSVVGMPTTDGTSNQTGNQGNGYAKITYLGE